MVTYEVNFGGLNQAAIAQEVVTSAVRILLSAGFSEATISDLFEQAAAQLISDEDAGQDYESDEIHLDNEDGPLDLWRLADEFDNTSPVKALKRLSKRAEALNDLGNPAALEKAVALLTEAIELRKQALEWLRCRAVESGIEVIPDREEWVEAASDDDLDREDELLFLDDYRWSGGFSWYLASQVIRELTQAGDRDALEAFCNNLLDEALAIEGRIREDVSKAIGEAGAFDEFRQYVMGHSGAGEQPQSEFLDRYVRSSGFSEGTYMLDSWLEGMSRRGELERYKRSNRWRVLVP